MLDIQFIRDNAEKVQQNAARRGSDVDIKAILKLDDSRKEIIKKEEELRATRKQGSKEKPTPGQMKEMKKIGESVKKFEAERKEVESKLLEKMSWLPNMLADDVPDGDSDEDNVEIRTGGKKPEFSFPIKDHFKLGTDLDLIDTERAARVSGARFFYLKNEAVLLRLALIQWTIQELMKEGFSPMFTPHLAKERTLFGTGYLPFFSEEIYKIEGEDLSLIGTSEQTLVGYHQDEVLSASDVPCLYAGLSSCFRTEAGSYGKDTKGIFRVHEFYKAELIVVCPPEESEKWHEKCQEIEEKLLSELGVHYRVVNICVGDMGAPGYKKYDCEAWFPGQDKYREVTSNTNITDFQTRRLNIKYKTAEGNLEFPHTISATGMTDRTLLAVLETFQNEDGSITIPKVLHPWMNGITKIEKKL